MQLSFPPGGLTSCLCVCLDTMLLPQFYSYPHFSEGADSVSGQMCGDKKCPFSGVTNSGRLWREVPESQVQRVCMQDSLNCQSPSAWSTCLSVCIYICLNMSHVMATRLSDLVFLLCRPLCPGVLPDSEHGDRKDPQDSVPNLGPDAHLWGD